MTLNTAKRQAQITAYHINRRILSTFAIRRFVKARHPMLVVICKFYNGVRARVHINNGERHGYHSDGAGPFGFIVDTSMVHGMVNLQPPLGKGDNKRANARAGKTDGEGADEATYIIRGMRYACAGIVSRRSSWLRGAMFGLAICLAC